MDTTTKINIWEQYKASGLHVFPISMPSKAPALQKGESWKVVNDNWTFNGAAAIGCGKLSGNIEVIDFDTKNTTRDLLTEFFEAGGDILTSVYKKVVVQTTVSGGYHFIYRCDKVEGNQKLAVSSDGETLIETRGEGGYFVVAPTDGYKFIQNDITTVQIPLITLDERDILIEAARKLNEYWPQVKTPTNKSFTGLTPWADFDQRGDVPALLQSHDWQFIKSHGDNDHYCRPGKKGTTSATWNESLRLFYCFTSSTEFEPSKAYTPSAVYTYLECNRDFSEAARKLISMGYGEKKQRETIESIKVGEPQQLRSTVINSLFIPTEEEVIISVKTHRITSIGNMTSIVAPPGAGKSIAVEMAAATAINPEAESIFEMAKAMRTLHIDTERTHNDCYKGYLRIKQRAGCEMDNLVFRSFINLHTAKDRRHELMNVVAAEAPRLVIIDGVSDFVNSVNDEPECGEFISLLLALANEFCFGVLATIHPNPKEETSKPRGHLGSEANRKSESMFLLTRDKVDRDVRILTTDFAYGKNRNGYDLIETYARWDNSRKMIVPDQDFIRQLPQRAEINYGTVFTGIMGTGGISYIDLTGMVAKTHGKSEATAKRWIKTATDMGIIRKDDKGYYRLIISHEV